LDNTREQALALSKATFELIETLKSDVAKKSPVDFDDLMLISNISGTPRELYERTERSLAIESKSGEKMISDLQRIMEQDLLVLLELLSDYAILYERMLNYPNAEAAISSILKERKKASIEDIPFAREHSIWYMRLYAMQSDRSVELKGTEERYMLIRREK